MKRIIVTVIAILSFSINTYAQHTGHSSTYLPAWTVAPIGIPDPGFGLDSTAPIDTSTYCTNWPTAEDLKCGYVDPSHGAATNTSNTLGYPDKPRLTIPTSITTSADDIVIKVNNGYSVTGNVTFTLNGSSSAKIYIDAVDCAGDQPVITAGATNRQFTFTGDYYYVICLKFENINFSVTAINSGFSYSEITGSNSGGSNIGIQANTDGFVLHRMWIHDNGTPLPLTVSEDDLHGIKISTSSTSTTRVWLVDSHIHNQSGDSIQCGTDPPGVADEALWPSLLYIGRNTFHTNGENAVDIKGCRDVITTMNDMFDMSAVYAFSDPGACMVLHGIGGGYQGATDTWTIFNKFHNCRVGLAATGQHNMYFIGNDVSSIAHEAADEPYPYTDGDNTVGSAIHTRGNAGAAVVIQHNTFHNNSNGVNCETTQVCWQKDNIYSSNTGGSAGVGWEGSSNTGSVNDNLLFHYGSSGMKMGNFGTTYHATVSAFNAAAGSTVDCGNCIEDDPDFTDASARDFTLQAGSPALAAGSEDRTYYDLFFSTYGISIKFDMDGNALPDTGDAIGSHQGESEPGGGGGNGPGFGQLRRIKRK